MSQIEPAYVVLVNDSKEGVVYPDIVGPITDSDLLAKVESYASALSESHQGSWGGYATYHVISGKCEDPVEWLESHDWLGDEGDG